MEIVMEVIDNTENMVLEEETVIHQSIVNFENEGEYLVRVFVNIIKQPSVIITVYKTSKLDKYYESKV